MSYKYNTMKLLVAFILILSLSYIDQTQIRYGDYKNFDAEKNHKVGTIESKQVYYKIPAYEGIKTGEYEKGTAKYTQALKETTMEYRRVMRVTAKKQDLKLIVEMGGVSDYPSKDITENCISHID